MLPPVPRRSARRRLARAVLAVAILYVILGLVLRPASPVRLAPVDGQPRLWRGAYHVHTTRSDGSGTPEDIASAASAAGLQFVLLTDHGDGTRVPDPPRYVDGVLLIDGVEISTDDGHYVALGMQQTPFPLGGDSRGVAEDVQRYGGLGIIAHPDSPRPSLAWRDPSVSADGFEWLNADSTWRRASVSQLLLRLAAYPFNRPGALAALAAYPEPLFELYDKPGSSTSTLALAAVDAHARIGWRRDADPLEGGRTLARFPSYRAVFGTFGIVVPWNAGAPTGRALPDADAVVLALRQGLAYSAIFSMADTPYLDVEALPGSLAVRSNAPGDALIRMRRNGRPWREAPAPEARFEVAADQPPAIYRAELWLAPRRGWPALPAAVGQAIGHDTPRPDTSARTDRATLPVAVTRWHGEHDPQSSVSVGAAGTAVATAALRLAPGPRVSQFAALVADLEPPPAGAVGLSVVLQADAPMRLSLQFRQPRPGEGLRWRRSVFVGTTGNDDALPLSEFQPIAPASGTVPLDRVHALLLVMDTVNAKPGDRRLVTVHQVRWILDR
jgi:hypothetical protein